MTSLKTSIKTITYLSDIGCLEIQGASLKLNLTDFITSKGVSDILDVVDWQWAFDSAKLNAKNTTVIDMDGREYAVTGGGYVMHQGVSLRGARDAMQNPSVDGLS
ncbi:hypothetical protein, partial [Escherichia coli]